MTKTFIQLRGCMASGKSSTAKQFLERSNFVTEYVEIFGKKLPYNIDKAKNIILTGKYGSRQCGGIDGIVTNTNVCYEYLVKLMKMNPNTIIFEGVMYGLTFKFAKKLNDICKALGYHYIGVLLIAPFDVLMDRLYARNNNKKIKVVERNRDYTMVINTNKKLEQGGVDVRVVDTSKIQKDRLYTIIESVLAEGCK